MTVEAHAFSHGIDITSSVGPFSWSAPARLLVSPGASMSVADRRGPDTHDQAGAVRA